MKKTILSKCDSCDGEGTTEHGDCPNCLGEGTRETLTFLEMVETIRALDFDGIDSVEYDGGKPGEMHGHAFVRLDNGRSISLRRGKYTFGTESDLFEADTPLRSEPYGRQTAEGVIDMIRKSIYRPSKM